MADDLFAVQDQVVLISGASRGIGRAIAKGFADRGAKVVISGRVQDTVEAAAEEIGAAVELGANAGTNHGSARLRLAARATPVASPLRASATSDSGISSRGTTQWPRSSSSKTSGAST